MTDDEMTHFVSGRPYVDVTELYVGCIMARTAMNVKKPKHKTLEESFVS
jgi:hypothetical protein